MNVTAVAVTYNGLPWIEKCLESLRDYPTIVVDHGSTDGTLELVRERFPQATLIEQENKGLGAGFNRGMREAGDADYFLLINSDAWVVGDAVERMARFADANPRVAVVGPRLRNPDGSLQRSVRGFPTIWRLSTEYLFLRKIAPRSRGVQRVLRRRLRARPRARSGFHHGGVLPRPPRGDRGSRALRRAVLHVQRGGRLVLALPPGGLGGRLLPGG